MDYWKQLLIKITVSASAGAQLIAEFIVKAPDMISFIAGALFFILVEGGR